MGIIWYFEVISFFVGGEWSTTTDIINMLQGVWVFLTFVCKRNVLQVILRKRDRLYTVVRQMTIDKSSEQLGKRKIFRSMKIFQTPITRWWGTRAQTQRGSEWLLWGLKRLGWCLSLAFEGPVFSWVWLDIMRRRCEETSNKLRNWYNWMKLPYRY